MIAHRRMTFCGVAEIVLHLTGVTVEEIRSGDKRTPIVRARRLAVYLCHEFCEMSFSEIAAQVGMANHTSALTACRGIGDKLSECAMEMEVNQ